jgi:hypothetical protein
VGPEEGVNVVLVDREEYDWLLAKLEEPPREIDEIQLLFAEPTVFDSE